VWTCSSAQPIFDLFHLHGSSLRVWLIQLLFRCLRSSSAPRRARPSAGRVWTPVSTFSFVVFSLVHQQHRVHDQTIQVRGPLSERRRAQGSVLRGCSSSWFCLRFNLERTAPSGSCLHSGSDATGAGSGCSSQFARCQLCLLCFLFKSFEFLCGFLGELLQGEAGIALESPDQKTRGFVVQIALPR
jgi:hypothetical protein